MLLARNIYRFWKYDLMVGVARAAKSTAIQYSHSTIPTYNLLLAVLGSRWRSTDGLGSERVRRATVSKPNLATDSSITASAIWPRLTTPLILVLPCRAQRPGFE